MGRGAATPFDGFAGRLIYDLHYWSVFWTLTLGWSYRGSGRRHFPRTGPALVLANHQSFLDPIFVSLAAGRPLSFLARSSLFRGGKFDRLIRRYGAVPIDRGFGKEGIRTVIGKLNEGRAVLVFPEGERTRTGDLQPLKAGVSLLIDRVRVPIVPVGIAGAFDAWPRGHKLPTAAPLVMPRNGKGIAVHVGEPIPPARYERLPREEMLADLERELRAAKDAAERLRRK
ncbi:lysophospholipid acyltransferase family protein [Limnoglobus roseus]|uniref:1-acyl-sn-glycerol-3-phosphate acyltransferase n=1 Tax=Limnoglobus roseus TaxID=2598579 RepID=A0A5C1A6R4_9BACT|nr:lysophospholipid acyltransferase family protein [Limnoglobus roseus]QEL13943.1 1-acyl-sn-glycerol-3-phosphate acyltransferase [Limnoglobus roseus]